MPASSALTPSAPASFTVVPPVLGMATVRSGTLRGLQFQAIEVEVSSRRGPAFFQLAGLAEAAVREARVRVSSALARLGISLEEYSLTVSLAPADLRKSGAGLDLALALSILHAIGYLSAPPAPQHLFLGELSLEGAVRPLRGMLPLLLGAQELSFREAFIPQENAAEAQYLSGLTIRPIHHLTELIAHLRGEQKIRSLPTLTFTPVTQLPPGDLSEVRGQWGAKRALEVAAAGHHNLLFTGPPGAGKSLLARRLPGILPPLQFEETLEVSAIHSVAGLLPPEQGVLTRPPFRDPHSSVTEVGLIGGGTHPRPGEMSLAHHGVLFLDELPEFRRSVLEALRQPLEEGEIHIVRAHSSVVFPARPLLLCAMNPCPCGHHGDGRIPCRCSPEQRRRYLSRLSGPLLDRMDLHVPVPALELNQWTQSPAQAPASLGSREIRQRVIEARLLQKERWERREVQARQNNQLSWDELTRVAQPDAEGQKLLSAAVERLALSARGYVRTLRVARTLADLDGSVAVRAFHLGEAIRYRVQEHTQTAPAAQRALPTEQI